MAAHGVNSVRTYTVPPRWLLDLAHEHGLWVMAGIPWEQHIAFLNDRGRARDRQNVGESIREIAGHPADPLLRDRQRDPGLDRALARPAADRALPAQALRRGQARGPGRAGHVRQLPEHRVPPAALHRPRLLQRVPRVGSPVRVLSRPAPEHRGRPAAARDRGRPRLPAQLRGCPGARARLAGPHGVRRRLFRHVRVLVDRRVASRRLRHRRLGVRPGGPRPLAQAGARHRRQGLLRDAVPHRSRLAPDLGGRVRVQQRGHAAQLLRRDCASSTTRTTRSSSSTTVRPTAPTRSRRSTASA